MHVTSILLFTILTLYSLGSQHLSADCKNPISTSDFEGGLCLEKKRPSSSRAEIPVPLSIARRKISLMPWSLILLPKWSQWAEIAVYSSLFFPSIKPQILLDWAKVILFLTLKSKRPRFIVAKLEESAFFFISSKFNPAL